MRPGQQPMPIDMRIQVVMESKGDHERTNGRTSMNFCGASTRGILMPTVLRRMGLPIEKRIGNQTARKRATIPRATFWAWSTG